MIQQRFGFAKKSPPAKCPDCNGKLGEVQYGVNYDPRKPRSPAYVRSDTFYRHCPCGCGVVWSFLANIGSGWIRRHDLPLFDRDPRVVMIVDDNRSHQ